MEDRQPAQQNKQSKLPPDGVAVFGGSFNPPGLHHLHIATALLQHFERLIIVPCGFRPDKIQIPHDHIPDSVRRDLVAATFGSLLGPRCELDYRDLESGTFTATVDLSEAYKDRGELWFVVGADLFSGGKNAESEIQSSWKRGTWIWENLNFACITRPGFRPDPVDLPPHRRLIALEISGSSSHIRDCLRKGISIESFVVPEVRRILENGTWYRQD